MRDGEVLAQAPDGLDAQDPVQLPTRWPRTMQIGDLGRRNRKAPIVERQIALQEAIGLLQRREPRQAQLLDQPVLEGFK
jgi:hypothetical protein